jgi:rhomboid family GlyGly-CTERM serine protease
LSLALLSVAVSLSPDAVALLELDRAAVARGEVWRVVSGHWTHWSLAHLVWDVIPFAALGAMCEVLDRRRFGLGLVISSVLISLSVISLQPEIDVYRGLSGLDSALLVLLAVSLIRAPGPAGWPIRIAALAVLAAFVGKIAFELLTGRALFVPDTAAGVVTVPLAHVVGAIVGLALALTGGQRGPSGVLSGARRSRRRSSAGLPAQPDSSWGRHRRGPSARGAPLRASRTSAPCARPRRPSSPGTPRSRPPACRGA